jgi:hypothetical protein
MQQPGAYRSGSLGILTAFKDGILGSAEAYRDGSLGDAASDAAAAAWSARTQAMTASRARRRLGTRVGRLHGFGDARSDAASAAAAQYAAAQYAAAHPKIAANTRSATQKRNTGRYPLPSFFGRVFGFRGVGEDAAVSASMSPTGVGIAVVGIGAVALIAYGLYRKK